MHELPKDLSQSLRSWRGSIYGNQSIRHVPSDLEKGPDDYNADDYDEKTGRALSPEQSSLILHPSVSSRSLQRNQPQGQQQQYQGRGHSQQQQSSGQDGQPKSSALAKRQGTMPPQTPASQKVSIFQHAPKVEDPDPAADRLDDDMRPLSKDHFYELIGMNPPDHNGQMPKKLATKNGLYGAVQAHHSYVQKKYRIFDVMTYIFMGTQLLLSAVFIILGSIRSNYHITIAVLGAISTVIAGALALMKGQGLPNRLRQVRDDLQNVMFEAEELYWDVAADRPVLFKDIKKVREDFMRVKMEARRNHPDSWTGSANDIAKGISTKVKTPPLK